MDCCFKSENLATREGTILGAVYGVLATIQSLGDAHSGTL